VPKSYRAIFPDLSPKDLQKQYYDNKVKNGYMLSDGIQSQGILVDNDGIPIQAPGSTKPLLTINYNDLNDPTSGISQSIIEHQQNFRLRIFVIFALLISGVVMIWGLLVSHKIAGPMKKLNQRLCEMAKDKQKIGEIHFREKDFFKEIPDSFNRFVNSLDEKPNSQGD